MNNQPRLQWKGPGWYASRAAVGPRGEIPWMTIKLIGDFDQCDHDGASNAAYIQGLGTPTWCDTEGELD